MSSEIVAIKKAIESPKSVYLGGYDHQSVNVLILESQTGGFYRLEEGERDNELVAACFRTLEGASKGSEEPVFSGMLKNIVIDRAAGSISAFQQLVNIYKTIALVGMLGSRQN